jgi:hypothetical protein
MRQFLLAGMDRAEASSPQEVHHHRAQKGEQRRADPLGVTVGVLTQVNVPDPVPLVFVAAQASAKRLLQRCRNSRSNAFGAVRRLVRKVWARSVRLPPLITLVTTSTIQLQPGQFALMCPGASLARRIQVVSRPCRFS